MLMCMSLCSRLGMPILRHGDLNSSDTQRLIQSLFAGKERFHKLGIWLNESPLKYVFELWLEKGKATLTYCYYLSKRSPTQFVPIGKLRTVSTEC